MTKIRGEELKPLHRLCYGKSGTTVTVKRDLRKFNGFSFDVNSREFEKRKALAMKLRGVEVTFERCTFNVVYLTFQGLSSCGFY